MTSCLVSFLIGEGRGGEGREGEGRGGEGRGGKGRGGEGRGGEGEEYVALSHSLALSLLACTYRAFRDTF